MRREGRAGFTLVELLIVLSIMALVAAIAVPELLRRAPASSLGAASEELRAALSSARSAAIAEDREVSVRGGDGAYRVDGARRPFASGTAIRVDVSGGAISFFPSGGSSGGTIVLRAGAASRALEVDALTGRAFLLQ